MVCSSFLFQEFPAGKGRKFGTDLVFKEAFADYKNGNAPVVKFTICPSGICSFNYATGTGACLSARSLSPDIMTVLTPLPHVTF